MGTDRIRAIAARLGDQRGYSLIELLMAVMVLVVGLLTVGTGFATSLKLSSFSERHATMAQIAQREIERIRAMSYQQTALNPQLSTPAQLTPAHSTDPNNPDYYLGAGTPLSLSWNRSSLTATETVDIDTTAGKVLPVQSWSAGNLSGQIYDFVTWTTDPRCGAGCPTSQNYKRVTVAVTTTRGEPKPVYTSSLVADPNAAPSGSVSNGNQNPLTTPGTTCLNAQQQTAPCVQGIDQGNANTWFLHDWSATGGAPQPPSADHPTHATTAPVAGLLCTVLSIVPALTAGCPKPDLMDANVPPGVPTTPLYHYSSDQGTTGYPGGRVLQPSGSCSTNSLTSNLTSHFWVSSPVTATTTLTGDGGLSMFTQTVGGVSAAVTFCIAIYDVPPSSGVAGSLANLLSWPPVELGAAAYTPPTWPTSATPSSFTFNFRGTNGAVAIASGHRLGVRIWINDAVSVAIAVVFDHPLFPAQLQLNSQ